MLDIQLYNQHGSLVTLLLLWHGRGSMFDALLLTGVMCCSLMNQDSSSCNVTIHEVEQMQVQECQNIPPAFLACLVCSVRRRCQACIDANGGDTKYLLCELLFLSVIRWMLWSAKHNIWRCVNDFSRRMSEHCHETKKLFLIYLNKLWHSILCLVNYLYCSEYGIKLAQYFRNKVGLDRPVCSVRCTEKPQHVPHVFRHE